MGPKVSVIITNYNYAQYVAQAINSVLNQTYSNIEVIVVNNGSTDNSLEILQAYGNQIHLVDQQNAGQSGARNSGLRQATGDIIGFLDADDIWEPSKIEKQLQLISKDSELIYCGISILDDNSQEDFSTQLPQFRGSCVSAFLNHPGVSIVLSGESTAIFTRKLLERVGDFDLSLNSAAGWDFFRRCSKYTNFDFVPEALTKYRLHASNMSRDSSRTIPDIRNAYRKFFSDNDWNLSSNFIRKTIVSLEYTFLKHYFRERKFASALGVGFTMFLRRRY